MKQMSYAEVEKINSGGTYGRIPLVKEIFSDTITPVLLVKKLKSVSKHCFLLESVEDTKQWGRYSFVGYNPVMEITCKDHHLEVKGERQLKKEVNHPGDYLRQLLKENKAPKIEGLPSFTGGLVGYFAYDYIKYVEPVLVLNAQDEENFNDLDLMLFDKLYIFDHYLQKIFMVVNIKTNHLPENYSGGLKRLKEMEEIVSKGKEATAVKSELKTSFTALFSQEEYCKKVAKVKEEIYQGNIFQLVLSNRFEAEFAGSLFDTYRVLRTTNPSPYMFYFSSSTLELAGASPETLVKVTGKKVYTYPLAGTRPRGKTKQEDLELAAALLKDKKELAEHNMLVDLGRNDLGRICEFGSVKVEQYTKVLRFSHVMHLGSTVEGRLGPDQDALAAIDSVLPAGTLSGAPKIRACQIINATEACKRGVYGGAIGYLDFTGDMDTCIGIRFAYHKNHKVFIRAGAGIVADSVPEKEYLECENKMKAVLNALEVATKGEKI
ncbi:MAG TPA: anthranilate synthase component I [Candidatus Dorea intestinavium]|nr:anthranilate synthase component I [Candidatus Dorea intestinavium]